MAPSNLRVRLQAKGWTVRDAADYLGVSRGRLYAVFADPARPRLWDLAVDNLPVCSPEIAADLKALRQRRPRPVPRGTTTAPGIEVNDVVLAITYVGIAEEGEEGWVSGVRGKGDKLAVQVRMPGGEDWFALADFHDLFITNGKTHQGA